MLTSCGALELRQLQYREMRFPYLLQLALRA